MSFPHPAAQVLARAFVPEWESGGWYLGCPLGMVESPLGHRHQDGSQKDRAGVEVRDQAWMGYELCLCPELLYRAHQAGNLRAWVYLGQVISVT